MNKRGRGLFILSFLAPAILIYGAVVIYPLFQSFRLSTYRWSGLSNRKTYVGADNFVALSHDGIFWRAVRGNLTVFVVGGFFILVIALAVAHGLQGSGKVSKTLRSIVLFPQMSSHNRTNSETSEIRQSAIDNRAHAVRRSLGSRLNATRIVLASNMTMKKFTTAIAVA